MTAGAARRALEDAEPACLWEDDPARPEPLDPLHADAHADLVVVGGGYTGLWTALLARRRRPDRSVLLLEADRCGAQASGRNGGFAAASLTHGFGNGLERWPEELAVLDRLGADNLAAIGRTVEELGIDCDWRPSGELSVATAPHHVPELRDLAAEMTAHGHPVDWLDADQVRGQVDSPTYLGALSDPHGTALVEPARLAWGLRRACLDEGVTVHERSAVRSVQRAGAALEVRTDRARVRAGQVVLATNAFPPLLRRLRLMSVPVHDYVLATEPLTREQLGSLGWSGRQGISDAAHQFHYYRLTRDDRIVWGGYDAVYRYGNRIDADHTAGTPTHRLLAEHFLQTFPQLEGVRFTHRWGGVIDTCTRFNAFYGTAHGGRTAYVLGYTGLGVAASRFGAQVVLDLLEGADTERTRLRMVRERPLPFPPEPVRYAGIQLTRRALDRSDRSGGRRGPWLRTLDRLGLGFDS